MAGIFFSLRSLGIGSLSFLGVYHYTMEYFVLMAFSMFIILGRMQCDVQRLINGWDFILVAFAGLSSVWRRGRDSVAGSISHAVLGTDYCI